MEFKINIMIIKEGTKIGNNTVIRKNNSISINNVINFNTKTKKATMLGMGLAKHDFSYVMTDKKGRIVTFKCYLKDCKAYDKTTGTEIK